PLDLVTGQPLPVFAATFYTPEMAKLVLSYKDHQRIKLAGAFRPIMYRTLRYAAEYCAAPAYRLVPIPASNASMRKRGYNPVTTMLPTALPRSITYDPALLKTRWHFFTPAAHHGTGIQARREAARKKFRLRSRHREPAEPVLLVDDVLTTGTTLAAATRLLQSAGFDVAGAVVLSAVMPRSEPTTHSRRAGILVILVKSHDQNLSWRPTTGSIMMTSGHGGTTRTEVLIVSPLTLLLLVHEEDLMALDINYLARDTDLTDDFRSYVEEKFDKISSLTEQAQRLEVKLVSRESHTGATGLVTAELTLHSPRNVVRSEANDNDKQIAFDHAFARLQERLRRLRERAK